MGFLGEILRVDISVDQGFVVRWVCNLLCVAWDDRLQGVSAGDGKDNHGGRVLEEIDCCHGSME